TAAVTMPSETAAFTEVFEAEIYKHLSETSALDDLHAELLFSLQRAGWTERIKSLSLELLRAGRCNHFDDLVDVVVTLAAGEPHPTVPEVNPTSATTNGHSTTNGVESDSESPFKNLDVRIPKEVVDQGVKAIKDSIRPIATIEDDGGVGGNASTAENSNHATKSEKK
ncbi:hypothetical protein BGW36DRAFT_265858, partial [Talaromyces proteolyticus]